MWGSVAEVLFGEQQQGFAVHLERSAGDGPQGELLLSPAQPLGHVVPAPEDGLQACRREREDAEGGGKEGRKGGGKERRGEVRGRRMRGLGRQGRKEEERQEGGGGGSKKDIEEVEIKGGGGEMNVGARMGRQNKRLKVDRLGEGAPNESEG